MPYSIGDSEEPRQRGAQRLPPIDGQSGNRRELGVIIRQRLTGHPIIEDQQQIGAVTLGRQARGVAEVISYIERHPCIGPFAHLCAPRRYRCLRHQLQLVLSWIVSQ